MNEITLALIKPHILKNICAIQNIEQILRNEFKILQTKKIILNLDVAEDFYQEHYGRFYYNRLVTYMASGPSNGYILSAPNCIEKWRNLMGPTKFFKAIYTHSDSLRSIYGLTDTRNGFHGSDSIASAKKEISILFPDFKLKNFEKICTEVLS